MGLSRTARIGAAALGLVVLAAVVAFRVGSPATDWICSLTVQTVLGRPALIERVRWTDIDTIRFHRLSVRSAGGTALLEANRGAIHLFSKRLYLKNMEIASSLASKIPLISTLISRWKNSTLGIQSLSIKLSEKKNQSTLHVLRCRSSDFSVKGGVQFSHRRIQKAHLLILVPRNRFLEFPKTIRARLLSRPHGFYGARLICSGGQFVVIGRNGPFFKAEWRLA